MGRLIDADHLLFLLNSAIELRKKLHRNISDLDMMVDVVNDEPTAYDPDKVVEQIKSLDLDGYTMLEDGKYYLIRKVDALSAVEGGGVDE